MENSLPEYKIVINDSVQDIPQRLKEYDESFFIVFDKIKGKFEVHSTDNLFSSYCFTVPYDTLDKRTIDIAMKNDTNKRSALDIEREIDDNNRRIEKRKQRDLDNWIEDVTKETYSDFKKDLDNEYIGMSRKGLYNDSKKDIRTRQASR